MNWTESRDTLAPKRQTPAKQSSLGQPVELLYESEMREESVTDGQVWVFKRNCSLSPKQLWGWYLSLCVVALGIASGFMLAGFWIVLPFAGLELALLGIAFLVYGRHAADYEMVEVDPMKLKVTVTSGSRKKEIDLVTQWTRLEYRGRYKEPLVLKCQGKQVHLGRFIADKDKPALHKDLKLALARAVSPV